MERQAFPLYAAKHHLPSTVMVFNFEMGGIRLTNAIQCSQRRISSHLITNGLKLLEPRHEKTCFCRMQTTKAHPRSLISAFVVRCLDYYNISNFYIRNFKPQLASVAAQAGLSLTWSEIPKTGFLVTWLILRLTAMQTVLNVWHCVCYMGSFTRKPVFKGCDQARPKPACSATETS